MFICLDCEHIFEDVKHYIETHGFSSPPYEEWSGCPRCGGTCVEAHQCDECGKWITGEYIKTTSGQRICENCYTVMDLGEEKF
jgi:hypothetical protein